MLRKVIFSVLKTLLERSLFGACVKISRRSKAHFSKIPHPEKLQRMRRGDNPFLKQPVQDLDPKLADSYLASALPLESTPPILLRLTADLPKPAIPCDLPLQTLDDDRRRTPKPPPKNFRSQRMHPATIRAPVTLHPKRLRKSLKIPFHISVPPQSPAPTLRTPWWPRPWVMLPLLRNLLDRKLKLDYHMSVVLVVSGSRDVRLLKPFKPEEGLQIFLRLFFWKETDCFKVGDCTAGLL